LPPLIDVFPVKRENELLVPSKRAKSVFIGQRSEKAPPTILLQFCVTYHVFSLSPRKMRIIKDIQR